MSSLRIFVEHAFGRMKGRFPWLRYITYHDIDEIYKTVEALLILHNFLEARNDDPTTIRGFHGAEDEDVDEVVGEAPAHMDLDGDDLFRAGLLRRKLLMDYMDSMN